MQKCFMFITSIWWLIISLNAIVFWFFEHFNPRLLYIKHNEKDFGWGAVVNFHKTVKKDKYHQEETIAYTVEVLMNVCKEAAKSKDIFMISPPEQPNQGEMQVSVCCYKIVIILPIDTDDKFISWSLHKTAQ